MGGARAGGKGGATFSQSAQNLLKSYVGAGILALPNAFARGGLLGTAIMTIMIAIASNYCIRLLIRCAEVLRRKKKDGAGSFHNAGEQEESKDVEREALLSNSNSDSAAAASASSSSSSPEVKSLHEVGFGAFGETGGQVANSVLLSAQVGFSIAYVSFISHNAHAIVPSFSQFEWVLIVTPLLMVLVQIRDFAHIAPSSMIGNILFASAIVFFFYYGFKDHCCIPIKDLSFMRAGGLPIVFGTLAFAMEGVGTVLAVESSMKNPSLFLPMVDAIFALIVALYLSVGILGYMFFGDDAKAVITVNLGTSKIADFIRIALSLSLVASYVVQMFPVTEVMDSYIARRVHLHVLLPENPITGSPIETDDTPSSLPHGAPVVAGQPFNRASHAVQRDSSASGAQLQAPDTPTAEEVERRLKLFNLYGTLGRIGIVAFTAFVAAVFKDFGLLLSLLGSLATGALGFVLPAVFYLKICKPAGGYTFDFAFAPGAVVILGGLASVAGLYFTVYETVHSKKLA